jgi:hypothetical protein
MLLVLFFTYILLDAGEAKRLHERVSQSAAGKGQTGPITVREFHHDM